MTRFADEKTEILSDLKKVLSSPEREAKEKVACLLAIGGKLNGSYHIPRRSRSNQPHLLSKRPLKKADQGLYQSKNKGRNQVNSVQI